MQKNNLTIKRITRYNKTALKEMNVLLLQLSSRGYQMTPAYFRQVLKNKNNFLLCLFDGKKIVGSATLVSMMQINGNKGYVENVVVDEQYRGRKLGKKIMLHIIQLAKKLKLYKIELQSEPERVVANILYKKMGFTQKDTNFYIMKFE